MYEAQIMIFFVVLFKGHFKLTLGGFLQRIVSLVPPIVDLGFLYSKLSQIFHQQYSLKKLKIWYYRSFSHIILVIKCNRDLNLQRWSWSHRLEVYVGDLKHELEVLVIADPHQRILRGSELDWIILVKFTANCIFLTINFYLI